MELMKIIDSNLNTHSIAFCIFSCRTLNNVYKLLTIIFIYNKKTNELTIQAKLCQKVTVFLSKTVFYIIFFQMLEKLETGKFWIW